MKKNIRMADSNIFDNLHSFKHHHFHFKYGAIEIVKHGGI